MIKATVLWAMFLFSFSLSRLRLTLPMCNRKPGRHNLPA